MLTESGEERCKREICKVLGYSVDRYSRGQTVYKPYNKVYVLAREVCKLAYQLQDRLEGLYHDILSLRPDLSPRVRHLLKLGVGLVGGCKERILDHIGRYLSFRRKLTHSADVYIEVVGYSLRNGRGLLKYGVKLFATEHARGHSLREL